MDSPYTLVVYQIKIMENNVTLQNNWYATIILEDSKLSERHSTSFLFVLNNAVHKVNT